MARQPSTGVLRLWIVPSVANKSAPTVAEITAGEDITPFLRRDGLQTPKSGSTIDASDVSSRFNKTGKGSFGGDPVRIQLYRDDTTDTAWDQLPPDTDTNVVLARFGFSGAGNDPAIGDVCEVWPITVVSREMVPIADNEMQRFESVCAVTDDPDDDAVVA